MNLHHLAEKIESGNFKMLNDLFGSPGDVYGQQQIEAFLNSYKNAICFDVGDAISILEFKPIPSLVRLPYPVCYFELDTGQQKSDRKHAIDRIGVLCGERKEADKNRILSALMFYRDNKIWTLAGDIEYNPLTGEASSRCFNEKRLQDNAAVMEVLCSFLSALHCNNTYFHEHKPSDALQKRRKKAGKMPIFSYHTLHLILPNNKNAINANGGHHNSPRLHLRRGHPRQYSPGKYTWVTPCVVGEKKSGMIHKDYAAQIQNERL